MRAHLFRLFFRCFVPLAGLPLAWMAWCSLGRAQERSEAPTERAAFDAATDFIVTSRTEGVLRVSADGAHREVISATPAAQGRRLGPHALLVLAADSNQLSRIDLRTGEARVIATLPADAGLGCGGVFGAADAPGAPYLVADYLQFEASMAVDDTHACFEVMDRNVNMASVILQIAVELDTGAVRTHVTYGESCTALDPSATDALPCSAALRRAARVPHRRTPDMPYSVVSRDEGSAIRGPRGMRPLALPEATLESTSITGRWAVLSGDPQESDYIYRTLYLFDARRGRVFALADPEAETSETTRPFPAPIPASVLADPLALSNLGWPATGETSIHWIEGGRTLLIGSSLVVRPGRGIVHLPGSLVR